MPHMQALTLPIAMSVFVQNSKVLPSYCASPISASQIIWPSNFLFVAEKNQEEGQVVAFLTLLRLPNHILTFPQSSSS
jgi:hypothetical protein